MLLNQHIMSKKLSNYDFEQHFRSFVKNKTDECPNQNTDVMSAYANEVRENKTILKFVEEVKDNRSSKFNIQAILKLKGLSFSIHNVTLIVTDINYLGCNSEDYPYHRFNYTISFKLIFNKHLTNEDMAHLMFQIENS
jgi:hypothetical protein